MSLHPSTTAIAAGLSQSDVFREPADETCSGGSSSANCPSRGASCEVQGAGASTTNGVTPGQRTEAVSACPTAEGVPGVSTFKGYLVVYVSDSLLNIADYGGLEADTYLTPHDVAMRVKSLLSQGVTALTVGRA